MTTAQVENRAGPKKVVKPRQNWVMMRRWLVPKQLLRIGERVKDHPFIKYHSWMTPICFTWSILYSNWKMRPMTRNISLIISTNIRTPIAPITLPGSQIREQMSGPDLHVFTVKFLALKKAIFSCFRGQKKFKNFFYKKGIMQLFSADVVFSKKCLFLSTLRV